MEEISVHVHMSLDIAEVGHCRRYFTSIDGTLCTWTITQVDQYQLGRGLFWMVTAIGYGNVM